MHLVHLFLFYGKKKEGKSIAVPAGGSTGGNEEAARSALEGAGYQNPSSGLVRYVAYGAQDYSYEEAMKYGLPLGVKPQEESQRIFEEAAKPLEASKPIVEQAYAERQRQLEGEKDPLMARYQALLDELTRREGQDIGQNTLALAREYGKRGVPLSSGVYEQNVLEKTRPIREFYGAQGKEVGFEREDKLRELGNLLAMLPIEKAKELNMINQQIAALKAQGATQGMQMAWEAYKFQREEYWKQQELDLRKQAFELQKWEAEQPEPIRYQLAQSGSNFYAFDPVQGALQMLQGQFGGG